MKETATWSRATIRRRWWQQCPTYNGTLPPGQLLAGCSADTRTVAFSASSRIMNPNGISGWQLTMTVPPVVALPQDCAAQTLTTPSRPCVLTHTPGTHSAVFTRRSATTLSKLNHPDAGPAELANCEPDCRFAEPRSAQARDDPAMTDLGGLFRHPGRRRHDRHRGAGSTRHRRLVPCLSETREWLMTTLCHYRKVSKVSKRNR